MRRLAAVALGGGLAFAALAGACATSGGDAQPQGPVFTLDGSGASAMDASPDDAPTNSGHDVASPDADGAMGMDATKPDDASDSGGPGELDADAGEPVDAADASSETSPDCGSRTAVLAGSASSLSGAVAVGTGAFTVQSITGASATLTPAVVATSNGFEALVAMSGDAGGGYPLFGLGYGSTWSSPAALGSSASAIDAPAVALLGANVEGAYLDPEHLFFHAEWAGTSWNAGTDPVTPSGGTQSFGPARASAAATATELVIAYEGNDLHLYAQSWTSAGGWQAAVEIGTSTLVSTTPPMMPPAPAIVALTPGGTDDFLVVYDAPANPPSEQHIYYAVRTASSKAWSTPAEISAAIYSPAAPTLAAMSGGRALLGWEGGNGLAYSAEYDPTPTPAWTTAVEIGSATVTAPPSIASGVCGGDAVAAVVSGGSVVVAKYASGAWAAPASIAGLSGVAVASVATQP
jgi:hypothetical protein